MITFKICVIIAIAAGGIGFVFDRLAGGNGIFSGGMTVVMGLLGFYTWWMEQKTKRMAKKWTAFQGEVTAFRTSVDAQNEKEYAAVVTVHTAQGDTEIIDHKWQKTVPPIGERKEVRLNPENIREGFVYHEETSVAMIPLTLSAGGLVSWILVRYLPDNFISWLFPGKIWENMGLRLVYLIGWVLFLLGGAILIDAWLFFRRALLVEGKITSFETQVTTGKRAQKQTMYAEVISFPFENGTRNVTGSVWTLSRPKMGTVRKVGIRPDRKNAFRVYSSIPYIAGSIFGLIGLITLVVLVAYTI